MKNLCCKSLILLAGWIVCLSETVSAFAPMTRTPGKTTSTLLHMAPKFDKKLNKWVPSSPEESAAAGYDVWGSLLRQGPTPFFTRIFQAENYDQGVMKMMAGDGLDRNTAQAEFDAYLQNPNDWAYNRLNGYKIDYLTLKTKQLALNLVWAAGILTLLGRGAYCAATGDYYWDILH